MKRVLVFSRDRALQLRAALDSFWLQAVDCADAEVVVLYRATSPRHQAQYQWLEKDLGDRARFFPEVDFRTQVVDILGESNGAIRSARSRPPQAPLPDNWLFFVDDCLFVRSFELTVVERALESNPDALGFSLRLGRNTTYCYSLDRPQSLPKFSESGSGPLKFRWKGAEGDFGYPLELSSSIYRFETINDLVPKLKFSSPSGLESQMALHARDFSRRCAALLCFEQSVAFCTPLNRVQDVFENRAGTSSRFSVERLADRFDEGQRINVRAIAGFVPNACHQEVELQFERIDDRNYSGR